jgi:hypothetical protein
VGFHTHRQPHHHGHDHAALTGHRVEAGDLVERVEHHPADARLHGRDQLVERLVVAVHRDPLRRETGAHRDRQLTAARDVEAQALLGDPAGHLGAQERLGRIVHRARPEGGGELGRAGAEVGLVDHEERGAVPLREVAYVDARDLQRAALTAAGVPRPHRGRELVEACGIERTGTRGLRRDRDAGVQRAGGMDVHESAS